MLSGSWVPEDPHQIEFANLPRITSVHSVVSVVRASGSDLARVDKKQGGVNQHNYLAHFRDKFWCIWSDGPGVEDRVGQRVAFSCSRDGLLWSPPKPLTPFPPDSGPDSPHYGTRSDKGFRHIARGLWKRNESLIALVAVDEAAGFFGKSLALHAYQLNPSDESWVHMGLVYRNAINNFPPLKLRTGEWMMSRRTHNYREEGVAFLIGGVASIDQWQSYPVHGTNTHLKAEEPDWWALPDQSLVAIFRDNGGSHFLHRALSRDDGRTWSEPVRTNFPDATSKLCGLRLSDGRYVMVSNPNPNRRDPLALSISDDGMVFTKMVYLVGDRHVDYPHVIEHDECLYVAFAGGKQSVEVLKVSLKDLDAIQMHH
jgi:hypothetical protein